MKLKPKKPKITLAGFGGRFEAGERVIDDPLEVGARMTAQVNVRESAISHMVSRGRLNLSQEAAGERFRQLWGRHDVHGREGRPTRIEHPQVGELTARREKLVVGGAKDQILVVYHAEPGTSSADKLALLASLDRPPARHTARRA